MIRNILAVSLGAITGALSRYYISIWLATILGVNFPYGTLFINITGSFLMGFIVSLTIEKIIILPLDILILITVGFLGSYTTFSSYELDSIRLMDEDRWFAFILYWFGSAFLGLLSIKSGQLLAKKISNLYF